MNDDLLAAFIHKKMRRAILGCDIHLYSEVKKDGVWVAEKADTYTEEKKEGEDYVYREMDATGDTSRDYWLFGLLAGVRTNWSFSFERRGMPEDASQILQTMGDGADWHSHSYLTVQELKEKAAELLLLNTPDANDNLPSLASFIESLGKVDVPDTDRRIVFWFDN